MLNLLFAGICFGCIPPPPPPPPPVIHHCSSVAIDLSAIATLKGFSRQAFEYGVSFDCKQVGNAIVPQAGFEIFEKK